MQAVMECPCFSLKEATLQAGVGLNVKSKLHGDQRSLPSTTLADGVWWNMMMSSTLVSSRMWRMTTNRPTACITMVPISSSDRTHEKTSVYQLTSGCCTWLKNYRLTARSLTIKVRCECPLLFLPVMVYVFFIVFYYLLILVWCFCYWV